MRETWFQICSTKFLALAFNSDILPLVLFFPLPVCCQLKRRFPELMKLVPPFSPHCARKMTRTRVGLLFLSSWGDLPYCCAEA